MTAGLLMAVSLSAPYAAGAATKAMTKAVSIEGAWKLTNVTVTGANPLTIESPQASLYIFSHGHYANVADTSRTPRTAAPAAKDPANPTDAEKLAKYQEWAPLAAQAGTYEVKGMTLIRHPTVAKNLAALAPGATPDAEIKVMGDTLVMTSKSPAGQPAREQKLTFTRVR